MHPSLRIRSRTWSKQNSDDQAQLVFDVWVYYLLRNVKDHKDALEDIYFELSNYEDQEEYEICAVLQQTIENYPQLSKLELRWYSGDGPTYH